MPRHALAAVLLWASSALADTLAPGLDTLFTISDWVGGLGQVTDLAFLPDGRAVIVEKEGAVKVRPATGGSLVAAGTFPVDTGSEKGLLGVAVDPSFGANGRLFFYYSLSNAAGGSDDNRHRVVSVTLKTDSTLDMATETVLVQNLRGPANHDGGGLAIGPDGKLYIGVGDTGCNSGVPPGGTIGNYFGTCLTNGNGKILRVNLDGSIPSDNPLVGVDAATACGLACDTNIATTSTAAPRTDIWAWGFRNPWRFSFDPMTGYLWAGDVGEVSYEEIDIVKRGRHHGWPWREGGLGYPVAQCQSILPNTGDCLDPVYFCKHPGAAGSFDSGCECIVGGVFVDSPTWPLPWRGRYYFGDCVSGAIWSLTPNAGRDGVAPSPRADFAATSGGAPVSFKLGPEGDLYAAVLSTPGRIARVSSRGVAGASPGTASSSCGNCGMSGAAPVLIWLSAPLLLRLRRRARTPSRDRGG